MAIVKWRGESIKKMIFTSSPTRWITLYLLDIKYDNKGFKKALTAFLMYVN
jgi:hypothetical protein